MTIANEPMVIVVTVRRIRSLKTRFFPQAVVTMAPTVVPSGSENGLVFHAWKQDLCGGCFNDCGQCCLGFWCPCVALGQVAHKVGSGNCATVGALFCAASVLTSVQAGAMTSVLNAIGWIGETYLVFTHRQAVRKRLRIPGGGCDDLCCSCCCPCCTIIQMHAQVGLRGCAFETPNPVNWDELAAKQNQPQGVQMQQQPQMVMMAPGQPQPGVVMAAPGQPMMMAPAPGQQMMMAPAPGQQMMMAPAPGQQMMMAPAPGQQMMVAPAPGQPMMQPQPGMMMQPQPGMMMAPAPGQPMMQPQPGMVMQPQPGVVVDAIAVGDPQK